MIFLPIFYKIFQITSLKQQRSFIFSAVLRINFVKTFSLLKGFFADKLEVKNALPQFLFFRFFVVLSKVVLNLTGVKICASLLCVVIYHVDCCAACGCFKNRCCVKVFAEVKTRTDARRQIGAQPRQNKRKDIKIMIDRYIIYKPLLRGVD